MKQRPSVLGAGWSLTQNYIYRDVNFTPSNKTDDIFKLILNGASYNLIFDNNNLFYHTETETFSRIQNLTTSTNAKGIYWLVTLKDGTQLRFGYNSDSELTSNTGYNYSLKWSLDQIQDTHNNQIFYSYQENPYPQDNGSVYLSQITYNNDEKRNIAFGYESSIRPDRRRVYEQGNVLEESRRLNDIYLFFNSTLVRRYNFEYTSLNNESSLSSLYKIRHIGADNTSVLHNITLGYYGTTSYYANSTKYNVSEVFSNSAGVDQGLRLVDLNNDGFTDLLKGKAGTKKAWLNNRTNWNESNNLAPPEDFIDGSNNDKGLRIADLNNDGFADLIQARNGVKNAWLNNISGWKQDSLTWNSPIDFIRFDGEIYIDEGVQLIDFNGDGKTDILQSKDSGTSGKKAYLNTGSGWKDVSSQVDIPTYFVKSDGNDFGSRLVDINGDGLIDIIQSYNFGTETKNAWLNNGSGWISSSIWIAPVIFTSTSKADNGIRFIDLNGDGLTDMLQDYKNGSATEREAFINNGNGWSNSTSWNSPEPFTLNGKNIGRRVGDVNGDGFGDIIIGYNDGADHKHTAVRNSTIPYLLKNITNEFGGLTYLNYDQSTSYNNTGDDGIFDIGFNVWVVKAYFQNNSLYNDFNIFSNTSYNYFGGKYDFNDSEFRGFNIVNETLNDKSVISHYFLQNKQLKGKEYKTEAYDSNSNIYSRIENNFNFTMRNNGIFVNNLLFSTSYTFDGDSLNPKITNISYQYDNYFNLINKINFGDVSLNGDEKYENYSYAYNQSSWILDKVSWYLLFDSNYNKIRETKYFYDNHQYGDPPSKGELTKIENYLDTGGGNPTAQYRYDDFGNLIEQADALGRVTRYDYGLQDSTSTYPERIVNALGHSTTYTYDVGTGNILTETKNGITKTNTYDTFGRVSKEVLPYDSSDFPTKYYTYNFDGIAPEIITVKQRTTSNNTLDTIYFYDGFGNLVQIKSPADYGQQVVKNLFYDGLFRVSSEQNPFFYNYSSNLTIISNDTLPANKTFYSYDAVGRIIKVINPDGTIKNTTYNKWEINDYDENRNYHTYQLDSYGRIISVAEHNTDFYLGDNLTYNTTYSYDGADELTGIQDTYGNTINFTIDSLGRKTKLNHPDLGIWNYEYDFANNLVKRSNSKGDVVLTSYDSLNRILQKNTTNETITFSYDKQFQGTLSNVSYESSIANFNNHTFAYFYDDKLRIIKETVYEGSDVDVTGNTYDSMDRIIESLQPNNLELDNYYNVQNKIDKIKGYINQTKYNPTGNPLNRTYFNGKVIQFDYQTNNLRLRQIKTDTIQQLNYSYDNTGNVLAINDSINNRSYKMGYDNLNRLTNVSINDFNWVYSYDAIGNILKIVRNYSQTTSFKYYDSPVHSPQRVITAQTGVDILRQSDLNSSSKAKVVEFYLINEKNSSIFNVNWSAEFGDNNLINSTVPFNLSLKENILVIIENNYTKGGDYIINLTGRSNSSSSDYERINLIFGAIANNLDVLKKNASNVITEFNAKNSLSEQSVNWTWNCSNGVSSSVPFNMSANEDLMVVMEHNYSLSQPNLSCSVYSADGNQSKFSTIIFDGIKIEGYNSTKTDSDTVLTKFNIKNYFSTQTVYWNISADNLFYNGSVALDQLQSYTVSQELNFSWGGKKQIFVSIGAGNFMDSYTEYYSVKWLDLNQFYSTIKNATTRIFDFLITNKNSINTNASFNLSNPVLNYSAGLANNESLIVVIEQDYSQGDKTVNIKIFNQTLQEDNLIEIFKIRQISIESLQTLYESDKTSIVSSVIKNNINPLNVSWRLNNTEQLINSTQGIYLNTSEQAIIVIENNFSSSGVYPLTFFINNSIYNDNQTGVAVT